MSDDRNTGIYLIPGSNLEIKILSDQWTLHGVEFSNCNCDHCCPCQFNAPTTFGFYNAVAVFVLMRETLTISPCTV